MSAALLALFACAAPVQGTGASLGDSGTAEPGQEDGGAGGSGGGEAPSPGVLVLAGGGSEGDLGDEAAWSSGLYRSLLEGGDIDGDGLRTVIVLSADEEGDWLPRYLEWLGADVAVHHAVPDGAAAAGVASAVAGADAVFIKGGDQGVYYDAWAGTALHAAIADLHARGGGVGGTSAGAMSLSAWSFAGGQDLVSDDVLADARTPWLDDADGGPGLKDDFLALLPGVIVDTHFTERGRLGRLVGLLAAAAELGAPPGLLGVGIEQRTGLVVRGSVAEVVGEGTVALIRPDPAHAALRPAGAPLQWRGLGLDLLVAGWSVDLGTGAVLPGPDAEAVTAASVGAGQAGEWYVDGDLPAHEERCAWVARRGEAPFSVQPGTDLPVLAGTACLVDVHATERRAPAQEAVAALLAEVPGTTAFLLARESSLERLAPDGSRVAFVANPEVGGAERATLVLGSAAVTHRQAGPVPSPYGGGTLHPTGLAGLRLDVLADTHGGGAESLGLAYDVLTHAPSTP